MTETVINTEQSNERLAAYRARQERMLAAQQARLPHLQARAVASLAILEERHGSIGPEAEASAYGGLRIAERAMQITKDRLRLARPTSDEDIAYRTKVVAELAPAIAKAAPKGLPLRFHGTPIYNVPAILREGGLTSSVDRLGAEASYDASDQVSVTSVNTLPVTLESYTGLLEEDCMLPAGCVFVLLPASKQDEQAGASMLMGNVSFTEHPEQLFGILTSEENVLAVKELAAESGIDPAKVHEFFEFPNELNRINQQLQGGELQLGSLIPYDPAE